MGRLYKIDGLADADKDVAMESMLDYMAENEFYIPDLSEGIADHLTYKAEEMGFIPPAYGVEVTCEAHDDLWRDSSGGVDIGLKSDEFVDARELLEKAYGDKLDEELFEMLYYAWEDAEPEDIKELHETIDTLKISFEPDDGAQVYDPQEKLERKGPYSVVWELEGKINEYIEPYMEELKDEATVYLEKNCTFEKLNEAFEEATYGRKALFNDDNELVGEAFDKSYSLGEEMVKRMNAEMSEKGGIKNLAAHLIANAKHEGMDTEKLLKGMKELAGEIKKQVNKERGDGRG